ncbi:component of SufBCD complex [Falsigemmobacter faecalis]|uniref:Component of SufBCD complex n=1 Tax=Falsigemmobacter faecalis TaxID=2488730 RepID=A0A3P3DEA3_9RHOB|nr:component of SufBCD complex [Falsigemmobacter faecalis]RRH72603.1 component of SufBCD complex [Falsigemmobacter faecalis]
MDILRLLPEIIDFYSFSNLWFWIALAVMWSRASHFVLGVPWDLVTRARRSGDPQVLRDITALAEIHARRICHIARAGGAVLTGAVFALLTLLVVLGFGYGLHLAQALALLLVPAMLTSVLSRRACLRIEAGAAADETFRLLSRHRFFVQLIGMIAIFVTSMWGMYQNLSVSILGN